MGQLSALAADGVWWTVHWTHVLRCVPGAGTIITAADGGAPGGDQQVLYSQWHTHSVHTHTLTHTHTHTHTHTAKSISNEPVTGIYLQCRNTVYKVMLCACEKTLQICRYSQSEYYIADCRHIPVKCMFLCTQCFYTSSNTLVTNDIRIWYSCVCCDPLASLQGMSGECFWLISLPLPRRSQSGLFVVTGPLTSSIGEECPPQACIGWPQPYWRVRELFFIFQHFAIRDELW